MSKKNKRSVKATPHHNPNYADQRKRERNAFIRNHPFLYALVYFATFAVGMYLFDLITKLF